jgi:hypothetical protein
MRHYSLWVYPRKQTDPSFEDLPPLLWEYKAIEIGILHTCRTVGLIAGEVFGTFILGPMGKQVFAAL